MPSRSILSRQLGYLIPIHSCYNINAFGNLSYVLYSCYLLLWPNHSWLTAPYQLLERNAANFWLRKSIFLTTRQSRLGSLPFEIVFYKRRHGADLHCVSVICRILKESIVRVEELLRQKEEELSRRATVVQAAKETQVQEVHLCESFLSRS